jgi:hypothetical protein
VSAPALTPPRLAAQLVTEFCIPVIAGNVRGKAPVEGRPLTQEERGALGAQGYGATVMYMADGGSVLLDMGGANSTVWFRNADCIGAVDIVEAALKRDFPAIRPLTDEPNPQDPNLRSRGFALDLGGGKRCTIALGYPLAHATGDSLIFAVRVTALVS